MADLTDDEELRRWDEREDLRWADEFVNIDPMVGPPQQPMPWRRFVAAERYESLQAEAEALRVAAEDVVTAAESLDHDGSIPCSLCDGIAAYRALALREKDV